MGASLYYDRLIERYGLPPDLMVNGEPMLCLRSELARLDLREYYFATSEISLGGLLVWLFCRSLHSLLDDIESAVHEMKQEMKR